MPSPTPDTSSPRHRRVLLISAGLIGYSAFGLPPAWYVPVNLVAAAGLLLLSRRIGLGSRDLGLDGSAVPAGLRWGAAAAALAALVLALAALVPGFRPLFDDARTAGIGPGLLAYRALVRIPLGTVLLEEVAFRGVLLGAWLRLSPVRTAVLGSSMVFGLWHVRPALDLLAENDLAAGGPERALAVVAAIAATTTAGVVFCWLRLKSGSLLAPYLAHVAVNSLATVAAFIV